MTQIEKILAEIERLMKWKPKAFPYGMRKRDMLNIRKTALLSLKNFINSLPAEQPSKDVEEAANKYADDNPSLCLENDGGIYEDFDGPRRNFIAGAQWQKEQTIDKACEWLRRCIDVGDKVKMIDGEPEAKSFIQKNIHRLEITNQIITDFEKAMEQ